MMTYLRDGNFRRWILGDTILNVVLAVCLFKHGMDGMTGISVIVDTICKWSIGLKSVLLVCAAAAAMAVGFHIVFNGGHIQEEILCFVKPFLLVQGRFLKFVVNAALFILIPGKIYNIFHKSDTPLFQYFLFVCNFTIFKQKIPNVIIITNIIRCANAKTNIIIFVYKGTLTVSSSLKRLPEFPFSSETYAMIWNSKKSMESILEQRVFIWSGVKTRIFPSSSRSRRVWMIPLLS